MFETVLARFLLRLWFARVDHVLEFFARFEIGHGLRGDLNPCTGLWIATDAGLTLLRAKTAKASNFDPFRCMQRLHYGVEYRLHDDF